MEVSETTNIPTLTAFQTRSLFEVANSDLTTYMLVRPNEQDSPGDQIQWNKNNEETDALIAMGLLKDVSPEYSKQLADFFKQNGRAYRVLEITGMARMMFHASLSSSPIN